MIVGGVVIRLRMNERGKEEMIREDTKEIKKKILGED